ncbi:MAG: ABC transporter permease, partial [Gemmatimonadota bacterium]
MGSGIMARVRSLWSGLRRRSAFEAEMREEFRLHVELRAKDLVRSGLSKSEALRRARAEFGSAERYKEEARASRGLQRVDALRFSWLDFKLGFRMLARYPGLTVVGGLAMAFAIAIGAGAFEAVLQVVRPKLPFPEGDRIVAIRTRDLAANRVQSAVAHDLVTWREQLASVRDLGAYRTVQRNLIKQQNESAPITIAEISATAFKLTGVAPMLGRFLVEADEQSGVPLVMVIGYDEWKTRFGGDSAVIGRNLRLGSVPVTLIGVMPKGYAFPFNHSAWTPLRLTTSSQTQRGGPQLEIFGRLAAGITLEEAQAELTAAGQRAATEFPATHQHLRPGVHRFAEANTPIQCTLSWSHCMSLVRAMLFSSNLLFVVLVALVCANVALLMFARAVTRESEIIVRNALGASRARIITQLVAEALVLGGVAAIVGLAAAGWALKVVVRLLEFEGQIPFWWRPSLSLPSVLYAVLLTLLGATIAGVLPALKVTRGLGVQIGRATAGTGRLAFGGIWTVVIVGQVALTVVAVASTVYLGQFAARMTSFRPDVAAHEYVSARLVLDDEIPANLYPELERRLLAEPGVAGVTFTSALPGGEHNVQYIEVEAVAAAPWVQTASVDADFFSTMNLPMAAGRGFLAGDLESNRNVVVVNESFVQRMLGGRHAVGRRVRFQVSRDQWSPWHEIVGVVQKNAMQRHPEMSPAGVYFPLKSGRSSVHIAVHLRRDPESFAPQLRNLAISLEPNLRVYE